MCLSPLPSPLLLLLLLLLFVLLLCQSPTNPQQLAPPSSYPVLLAIVNTTTTHKLAPFLNKVIPVICHLLYFSLFFPSDLLTLTTPRTPHQSLSPSPKLLQSLISSSQSSSCSPSSSTSSSSSSPQPGLVRYSSPLVSVSCQLCPAPTA
ncbi:hypothetical protein Pmani_038201 [Petrolisthes manimaculis]|uniref:Uncharacterized protein n=1 Tax=Petrolisthes manimaculis TaxID=1843537 RepID=A0AAE1NG97_9EUCA|nr:hypothetical protein Pmani_038201 [Petrolisthes manimaculis]